MRAGGTLAGVEPRSGPLLVGALYTALAPFSSWALALSHALALADFARRMPVNSDSTHWAAQYVAASQTTDIATHRLP